MCRFIQYLRPYGNKKEVLVDRPPEIETKAQTLWENSCRLECEVLTTDEVSLTCERGGETLAIEISPNGPEVLDAVDKVVETAFKKV